MKTFRELYIKGNKESLSRFVEDIAQYVHEPWNRSVKKIESCKYLFFDYQGNKKPKARVSILINDEYQDNLLRVGNIIPLEKNELSIDEYNQLLLLFYNEIIIPFTEENDYVTIDSPSNDEFNPLTYISASALKKLEKFSRLSNKATGNSHSTDRKLWLDFVTQTVDDNQMIDFGTLCKFLQDEEFWQDKGGAWSESVAVMLAEDYERGCDIIIYDRNKNNRHN